MHCGVVHDGEYGVGVVDGFGSEFELQVWEFGFGFGDAEVAVVDDIEMAVVEFNGERHVGGGRDLGGGRRRWWWWMSGGVVGWRSG